MRSHSHKISLFVGVGLVLACAAVPSGAQPGRDDDGAVLRLPGEEPRPKSGSLPSANPGTSVSDTGGGSTTDIILANLTVDPRYAMNLKYQPTPDLGPWMICVHSYITKEAPEWAQQMAIEFRSNNAYRLQAYVFTYGLEERRKEYDRVKNLIEKQRGALKSKELDIIYGRGEGATVSNDLPLAYAMRLLKVQHMPVQCAVLVGGYPNEDAAHRALLQIKKLKQPDPGRVKLDIKYYGSGFAEAKDGSALTFVKDSSQAHYVNPFHKAFVCRNPAIKQDHVDASKNGMNIEALRNLNAKEEYSLLNCKKPVTLAIKQFQTHTTIQGKDAKPGIFEKIGYNTVTKDGVDQAAHDAHQVAHYLRKNGLDAYALHTQFSSVVTVGGFDSPDDPNLIAMQKTLTERLRILESRMSSKSLSFFPQPMPMKVPR